MCAIAGFIDYSENIKDRREIFDKMSRTMVNRGPDDDGMWICENAALIHRRLSVIDIENGKQPMTRRVGDNQYIIVYNGELYNTTELRAELLQAGYAFAGHCDTEVLLCSYIEWGEKCLEKLNGIFAFAIWNEKEESLFLARDRMGVKPLFYSCKGGKLVFASEIKTILAHPDIKPQIERSGIAQLFLLGPGRVPGSGVFKGVDELMPGYCMTFSKSGLFVKRYWSLETFPHEDSLEKTVEKVRWLVTDSITRQLVSDVPLCTFLSGGLDSSIITAVASEKYKAEGNVLSTFSVDYVDNDLYFKQSLFQPDSDAEWIGKMSAFSGSRHTNYVIDTDALIEALYEATDARDLPGMADVDSSLLLFCRRVKENFKVAVSGECADEVFGGYPWYHNPEMLFENTFPWSRSADLRLSLLKSGLLNPKYASDYAKGYYSDTVKATPKHGGESDIDSRIKEMTFLNLNWFMQTLLDRKDRMSMACGLEVRVPFCDHRIVEYVYNIPWEMKALNGREKGILREAAKDILPLDVAMRKKSPYPKTFNPAYVSGVRAKLKEIMDKKNSPLLQLVNPKSIIELIKSTADDPRFRLYGQLMAAPQTMAYLVTLNYWLEKYDVEIDI